MSLFDLDLDLRLYSVFKVRPVIRRDPIALRLGGFLVTFPKMQGFSQKAQWA